MTNQRKTFPVRVNELIRSTCRSYFDLNGPWDFQLDRDASGVGTKMTRGGGRYEDSIEVPGCLEAQGKGLIRAPVSRPEWAGGPDVPYLGVSWYRKRFALPADFAGDAVLLNFGGVATDCEVWLNGNSLGEHHYAALPFGFDVTDAVERAGENLLVVRVENRHTYSERTPSGTHGFGSSTIEMRWSGVYRGVEVVGVPRLHFRSIYLKPSAKKREVECRYEVDLGESGQARGLAVHARISEWKSPRAVGSGSTPMAAGGSGAVTVEVASPHLWSDDDPFLYLAELTIVRGSDTPLDSIAERFGLRDIEFDGRYVLLNGAPTYLRGDMSHYHWPGTIAFPTDREELLRKLITYKRYGFNFARHHTFFPSVEYLDVCDEIGLLCHNELGVASNSWSIPKSDGKTMWEALLRRDRNHPAIIIWCLGNEIIHEAKAGDLPDPATVKRFAEVTFRVDPTRLLQTNSPGFFVSPDGTRRKAPIHHELRKAGASYIDPSLKSLYTGALRPWRMQWAEERTREVGLDRFLPLFTRNTQLLQARCRKIILEELRLNRESVIDEYYLSEMEYQGYELCTFRDSGSFVWGVVDDYFNPKIVPPEELSRYNGSTILAWGTKWTKRCFAKGFATKFVPVDIHCSHYGKRAVQGAFLRWEVLDPDDAVVADGKIRGIDLACGETGKIADDRWYFHDVERASRMRLRATLSGDGIIAENEWDFWCFPSARVEGLGRQVFERDAGWEFSNYLVRTYPFIRIAVDAIDVDSLLITGRVDEFLLGHLRAGGRALLVGRDNFSGEVTEWGAGRSEFPRGTIIFDHPLMRMFPHEGWCDIPFSGMISGGVEINGRARNDCGFVIGMREWPPELEPIIMGIPSYKQENPQKLAHLFEVKVGRGRLMVTSLDLGSYGALNPATEYFTDLLLRYLESDEFKPLFEVDAAFLKAVTDPRSRRRRREGSATGR